MRRLRTILGTALLLSLLAAQASAQVVCEGLTAQHPLTYRSPTYGYSLAYLDCVSSRFAFGLAC